MHQLQEVAIFEACCCQSPTAAANNEDGMGMQSVESLMDYLPLLGSSYSQCTFAAAAAFAKKANAIAGKILSCFEEGI